MRIAQPATLLFAFWVVLTGSLGPIDLVVGAVLSLLLAWWASSSLWGDDAPVLTAKQALRFVLYIGYLIVEIVKAAIGVAERVLDPRMRIAPVMITHRTGLERTVSQVALANSITLTPGTLTVDIEGPVVHVHCLEEGFAESIVNGEFETAIGRVFEE